ncbi:MAG: class II SORL domain-containing protein [Phycisphaerae bacterium]|nr:class II SORL domain-containing protein [Phycisphaerae bacterium]
MAQQLGELLQTADWKKEKHVPIIECADNWSPDDFAEVTVTLGKEVAHPNTTEHHIRWIELFFQPEGAKTYQVARFDFTAHGESAKGANEGPVYTHHEGKVRVKASAPGTLYALAYCNIHGLWQSSKDITVG